MKMKSVFATACVLASAVLFGADRGSSESSAIAYTVGGSVNVTLSNEYDPDLGYYDSGVKYYKATLKKGYSYTFWISGGNAVNLDLEAYWRSETDAEMEKDIWSPMAFFEGQEFGGGATKAQFLHGDTWDADDPASWVCYIKVSGENIGDRCTLNSAQQIVNFTQIGEQENPRRITITDTQVKDQRNLIEGEYWYIATLEAGRKYLIRTVMGSKDLPIDVLIDGGTFYFEPAPAYTNDLYNGSYFVYPEQTGDYTFQVLSKGDGAEPFKLAYRSYPSRKPGEHPTVKLYEQYDYTAEARPGRRIGDQSYYDNVIDEDLFRIKLKAGERWVFNAVGATKLVEMQLYDVNGSVLAQNETIGNGSFDTRAAVETTYDGWYYVGVCDPEAEYWMDRPDRESVVVSAVPAETYPDADAFDAEDGVYTGASVLTAYPGVAGDAVTEVGFAHGPHAFNGSDWYDWYAVDCRAGLTYVFRTKFLGDETSSLTLKAKVYRMVDGSLQKIAANGTLTPESVDAEGLAPLNFKPEVGGRYYIRVSVGEGVGLDYPAHTMCAMVYGDKALGLLQVKTKGVETTWRLTDDSSVLYANGAIVAYPVDEVKNIGFTDAGGFITPEKMKSVAVVPWTGSEDSITVKTGVYVDEFDHVDDVEEGYVDIIPASTNAKAKRTLWTAATDGVDDVDYFRFKAYAGYYYNFYLTDTTLDSAGDAVFSIINKASGETVVEKTTSVLKRHYEPGKHYIRVEHGQTPAVDSSYRLYYSYANVGTVQFTQEQYVVNDTDAYVDLTVTRSASDGALRLKYATQAKAPQPDQAVAQPGEDYYPTEGTLAWAAGDGAPKTIRVKLIPDLKPVNTGTRRFIVKIWPIAEGALEDDEYEATISGDDFAAVKIKDPTALDPGEVVLVGPRTVSPDSETTYSLERRGGSQGRIAVKIKTQDLTTTMHKDYEYYNHVFVWEDGELGSTNKSFTLTTLEAQDLVKTKQLRFKVYWPGASDEKYADYAQPVIAEKFVPITIDNDLIDQTFDEVKAAAKSAGVGISVSGTWYAETTQFKCVPPVEGGSVKTTFTVTGPGFFVMEPQVEAGPGVLRYMIGNGDWVDCSDGGRFVLPIHADPGVQTAIGVKLNGTDGSSYVSFARQIGGLPFKWIPIASAQAAAPCDQSVVALAQDKLVWSAPAGADGESIWYRVRAKASTTTKQAKCLIVLTNGTEKTECEIPSEALPMTAGQTYAWVIDYAVSDAPDPDFDALDWVVGQTVWHFTTAANGAFQTQCSGKDAYGDAIDGSKPVQLVQGVAIDLAFRDNGLAGGDTLTLVSGELPPGIEMKKATKKRIGGVPTTPGDYTALFRVDGAVQGETLTLKFHVAELGTGLGSFAGTLKEDGGSLTNGYPRLGKLTFTAAPDGNISAKAKVGNATYTFTSSDGYDLVQDRTDDTVTVVVSLVNETAINGVTYKNTLDVTLTAGSTNDVAALGVVPSRVRLNCAIPDENGLGAQENIDYVCDLYRATSGQVQYDATMSAFAGYYTVSLVPFGVQPKDGVPCGNGYLTMTVAEDGTAQIAGRLADGSEFSLSSTGQLVGDVTDPEKCDLHIPLCGRVSPACIGGVLKLNCKDGVTTVDSLEDLEWCKDGKYSSYDRKGFRITISPTGGWYDTVVNLQAYYLYRDFTAETDPIDGLPEELLPAGYSYTPMTTPSGVEVTFASDVMTPATRSLVADEDDPSRYDFSRSVNPWKVKTSFVRATGVLTGTFKAWSDDGITQSQFATYNHYGVVLMNRNEKTSLLKDMNILTAGFYLAPVTSKWTLSMPFNILWTENGRNGWQESEALNDEDEDPQSGTLMLIF